MMFFRPLLVVALAACVLPAAAQTKPLLILEPGNYSYTIELPPGWSVSAEEALRMNVPFMLFPTGRSLTQSGSIVFINEFCRTPCANIEEPIGIIIKHARTRDSDNKVESATPVTTRDAAPVELRIINSTINKRQVREAFAFINNPGGTAVLSRLAVGDVALWDRDFAAFLTTLQSFRFFDCKPPAPASSAGMCGPDPVIELDPNSFAGRSSIAKQLVATPEGEGYRQDMNRYLGYRHSRTMRDCIANMPDPWTANFEFVANVMPSGVITDLVVQPETNIAKCFTTGLLGTSFPRPPKMEGGEGYPVHMEIRLQP